VVESGRRLHSNSSMNWHREPGKKGECKSRWRRRSKRIQAAEVQEEELGIMHVVREEEIEREVHSETGAQPCEED